MAAAHLGVCWPESVVSGWSIRLLELEGEVDVPVPLASEILKDSAAIEQGDLVAPREPGLGVRSMKSVIDRYPWIPGPGHSFRLDSRPEPGR